jgi:hypothetical protein
MILTLGIFAPVQTQATSEGGGYWVPDGKIKKATELMKQGKSLGELEIKQDQIQQKEGIQTLDELMEVDQQSKATYRANLAPPI